MSLVSKDEPLATSMVTVGYHILKQLDATDDGRLSLSAIAVSLKKKQITQYRPIMFALIFLHSAGAIEFKSPYIYRT